LYPPPNNAYAYRAYIETLLNYDLAAKNSYLISVLWYEDTSDAMDNLLNLNKGYVKRRSLTKGKKIDLMSHLRGSFEKSVQSERNGTTGAYRSYV